MALLALSIIGYDKALTYPGYYAVVPVLGTALLIAAGPCGIINRSLLAHRVPVSIGLISYPLYLWHWPLLALANIVTLNHSGAGLRSALIVAALGLSWLTYLYIERPLRYGAYNLRKVIGLTLCVAALGGVGLVGSKLQGIGSRFPQIENYLPVVKFSTIRDWREHTCFLQPDDYAGGFGESCTERTGKPLLALWGDSHAAALYPGLHHLQAALGFDIGQYTASSCLPYLTHHQDNPDCVEVTTKIMAQIDLARPAVVVLHGRWSEGYDPDSLQQTVAALRAANVQKILLVGPVPEWENSLPQSMQAHYIAQKTIPARLLTGVKPEQHKLDSDMAAFAQGNGLDYLSAYQVFCNAEGCLISVDDSAVQLTALDYGHLTPLASRLLMSRVTDTLRRLIEP